MDITSIRKRLLFILLPFFFLFFGSLSAMVYYFTHQTLSTSIRETAKAVGADYANQIQADIDAKMIYLQQLSETRRVQSGEPAQIIDALAGTQRLVPSLETIVYIAPDGSGFRANGSTDNFADRTYFAKVLATKEPYVSAPLISKGQQKLSIILVMPVITNGQLQAMLAVAYSLDKLSERLKPLVFKETGYGFVTDSSGLVIAHPTIPALVGKLRLSEKNIDPALRLPQKELDDHLVGLFRKAVDNNRQVQGEYSFIDGTKQLAVFTPVDLPGPTRWILAVAAPAAEVNKELILLTYIMLGLLFAGTAIGSLFIIVVSERLSLPIRLLRDECLLLTQGDLGERDLQIALKDEIGQLANGFCQMRTQLRKMLEDLAAKNHLLEKEIQKREEAQHALELAHAGLEQKVEEKTHELWAANQELTSMNEEILAMNETLNDTNQRLHEEIVTRHQTESSLLLRERQYRATTGLLTRPANELDGLLETILQNALQLIKAPDGYIGIYDNQETCYIRQAIGVYQALMRKPLPAGLYEEVLRTGELHYEANYRQNPGRTEDERLARVSSVIIFPLKRDGQVIGVLGASWADEVQPLDEDNAAILGQFADLASVAMERAYNFNRLRYTALHDSLTGLPNRAQLKERLEVELEKARRGESAGAILFIDLDDLKTVNDSLGHQHGDALIIKSGAFIVAETGKDGFVARLGGDEFIALLPGERTPQQIADIAERLTTALAYEHDAADIQLQISASIGVAVYPANGDTADELLKNADNAMYAAKRAGKNCWRFYEASMQAETYEQMTLTANLRAALGRNELTVFYQPQVRAGDHAVIGFEALLRWNSRQHGAVSPVRFIPLAEKSGLIQTIGQFVLQEACRFAKKLAAGGWADIRVGVNVSPVQLSAESFISVVQAAIASAGIAPGQLELEITETALMSSLESTARNLAALNALGVRLALDDFGTGYSSLTYLHRLPVNTLKIDKSFIDMILTNTAHTSIIGNIVDMAHSLEMAVVAEGVETRKQADFLAESRCDYMQGYYFGRPVPEAEAITYLPD